jgi:hypothetical protein
MDASTNWPGRKEGSEEVERLRLLPGGLSGSKSPDEMGPFMLPHAVRPRMERAERAQRGFIDGEKIARGCMRVNVIPG